MYALVLKQHEELTTLRNDTIKFVKDVQCTVYDVYIMRLM